MGGKGINQKGEGAPAKIDIHEGYSELDRFGPLEKDCNSSTERCWEGGIQEGSLRIWEKERSCQGGTKETIWTNTYW